jgi:hypothetical protein
LEFEIRIRRLRIGQHVQVGIDLLKRIGQKKNPDTDHEKTAHDGDHPHVPFYFIKGREERIKSQGREKKWNSQTD